MSEIEYLYHAAGPAESDWRVLHVATDCPGLSAASATASCSASRPPRGRLCEICAPDRDLQEWATGLLVQACPACDDADIGKRSADRYDDDERWLCKACRNEFERPVTRQRKNIGNMSVTGRALIEADSDDLVGGDGGGGDG